ncbi:MAG: DUF58 domain-containing protein [Gammaproteobacteria bacterium]|nr:DUF58 domain-containing protein [Gammaproteobacteria bacterium]
MVLNFLNVLKKIRPRLKGMAEGKSRHSELEGVTCSFSALVRLHQPASELLFDRFPRSAASISGEIRSLFRGQGMEYCESRVYQQGDDVRTMDWRVTARTTVPHVKVFQDEKERPVFLVVDQSQTMHFATRRQFKSVQATKVAALLGWAGVELGDKVGGVVIKPETQYEIKPLLGDRSILTLFNKMAIEQAHHMGSLGSTELNGEALESRVSNELKEGLQRVSQLARRGSLVFVVSDFYHLDESLESVLFELQKGRDVVMVLVYDPIEKQILPAGQYQISNGVDSLELNYADESTRRKPYLEYFARRQALQKFCQQHHLRFIEVSTEQNELDALQVGILGMTTSHTGAAQEDPEQNTASHFFQKRMR